MTPLEIAKKLSFKDHEWIKINLSELHRLAQHYIDLHEKVTDEKDKADKLRASIVGDDTTSFSLAAHYEGGRSDMCIVILKLIEGEKHE